MSSSEATDHFVGFDLGGTKMLAVVFDSNFKIIGRRRRKTKGYEGVEAGIKRINETIRQALEDADVKPEQVRGIGIGCPAPVDLEKGIILDAVNLGWRDVPLQAKLEGRFDCPVAVLNDVDAGVYGENRFGAAKGSRTVVGIFPGTGIGGGCVYNGEILRGSSSSGMEIGHICINPRGSLCGCGSYGCLETEASRLAIAGNAAKAAYRGQAPHLMKNVGTEVSEIRSGALAAAIEAGDKAVEQIVRDAAALIGAAASSVITLLLPNTLLLGGGLVEAMPKLFVSEVRKAANAGVMPAYRDSFDVVAAKLGDDAAVMGVAGWVERFGQRG